MNAANETAITLIGNVANEPEHRTTGSGATIASFRLACTSRYYDRAQNAWVDRETSFYAVSAFRGLGDHVLRSLHRGDRVVLAGRLQLRKWESGTTSGTAAEVEADAIGHDLRWGTSTFEKAARPAAAAATTWAVPGEAAAPSPDSPAEAPTPTSPGEPADAPF
ncbi:single-stranded DNA-binding protein [Microbacterium awajiense]